MAPRNTYVRTMVQESLSNSSCLGVMKWGLPCIIPCVYICSGINQDSNDRNCLQGLFVCDFPISRGYLKQRSPSILAARINVCSCVQESLRNSSCLGVMKWGLPCIIPCVYICSSTNKDSDERRVFVEHSRVVQWGPVIFIASLQVCSRINQSYGNGCVF